ncbi:MAG: ATP-binding cassette domain-containing protein [Corynebacterium sp.]|nr:ATP-binding cassette domain-containing protein [Corynebacterium sp.]
MATVDFENVTIRYPGADSPSVSNLDLHIADGEFLVLVGPSGCGKSTTLRALAGLEKVTDGQVLIGGRDVTQAEPADRDIAMVFQNYALYPHMSVAKNMGFSLKLAKMPQAEIDAKVAEAARILGLEEYLDRKPKDLSGGQRQRVAMGRAIVRNPQVFLMDEPLSNLDAKLRVQTRAEIAALQKRLHVTTVYVTHDQVEAMTMGDRVAVLKDGILQQVDTPQNLYNHPINAFVAGFIGSPAMNLIHFDLPDRGRVLYGIRPDNVRVVTGGPEDNPGMRLIPVVVDLVEELGNEAFVYAHQHDDPSVTVVCRVREGAYPAHGEQVTFGLDESAAHYFNPQTGERLAD